MAIGTHRVSDGIIERIKFEDPETKEPMNSFAFVNKFVETPEIAFTEMSKEEKKARTKYLWKKLRMIVRTRGFLNEIMFDGVVRKQSMHGLDTDISFEYDLRLSEK